jgi:hypothetical protein
MKSKDTQIARKLNHNQSISLRMYLKKCFSFLRFFMNLYEVDCQNCQDY